MQVNLHSPMEPPAFAARIRARRLELGLTPADLAYVAGVSHTAVQKWEAGEAKQLRHDNLFAIADALGVNPRWLATGRGPKAPEAGHIARLVEHLRLLYGGGLEIAAAAVGKRDRADSDGAKKLWQRIADAAVKAVVVVTFALPPFLAAPNEAIASAFNITNSILHIVGVRLRRLWRTIVRPEFQFRTTA